MSNKNWIKIEAPQIPAWNSKNEEDVFSLKEGDEMIGQFQEIKTNIGPNHANLYIFKQENGEEISIWGSTILDTRLKNLVVDEWVKIVYLGEVPNKVKGRAAYRNYEVWHGEEMAEENNNIPIIEEPTF